MAEPQYDVAFGTHPKGIAGGAFGFYAGLFDSSELALFDAATGSRLWQRSTGPGRTNGVAAWGNYVITTNRDAGAATLHDASSGALLAVVGVGGLPWGVAADGGRAFVANFGDSTVTIIDLALRQAVGTVGVGAYPVALATGGGRVYVVHLDGRVIMLDGQGQILAQGQSDAYISFGIASDPLRNRVYVGSREGRIAVLSADTLTQVGGWGLPGPVYAMTVNPATGRVFAVDAANDRLYVVEPDGSGVGQISLPRQDADEGGQGIAVWDNRIAVPNYAAGTLTVIRDTACTARLTPAAATRTPTPSQLSVGVETPTRAATQVASPQPGAATQPPTASATLTPTTTRTLAPASVTPASTATRTPSPTVIPTPAIIRAKIEIVWPHGNASVREADLANITAYLLSETGNDPAPCAWEPVVRLWQALNAEPARPIAVGRKRMLTTSGRTFPVWDFNDIDVRAARDPASKLSFFVTVDGVRTLHNVWTHAADARTVFPNPDVPVGTVGSPPLAVDARIEIVWPLTSAGQPANQATRANITAYLFGAGTKLALPPALPASLAGRAWPPVVRLHWSLNAEADKGDASTVLGVPRTATTGSGVQFLVWDFNDVDISAARDPLNRIYFWVTVDEVASFSNIWVHGLDARSIVPQVDLLNSCR